MKKEEKKKIENLILDLKHYTISIRDAIKYLEEMVK